MENNQEKQMLKVLKDIDAKISILIALQKSTLKPPKIGTEENIVLKLCNGKNSVNDMIVSTKKTRDNIKKILSNLRKKGIIKTTKINQKTVYVKL